MQRLKLEPLSQWRSEQLGGEKHFGWSLDSYLLANLQDLLSAQLKGKKLRESEKVPRPVVKLKKKERKEKFDPHHGVKNMRLGLLFPED